MTAPYSAIFWCHVVLLAATTLGALYIVLFVRLDMTNMWMVFLWRVMPFLIPILLLGRTIVLGRCAAGCAVPSPS